MAVLIEKILSKRWIQMTIEIRKSGDSENHPTIFVSMRSELTGDAVTVLAEGDPKKIVNKALAALKDLRK